MSSRHTSASAAILVTGGGTGIGAAVTRELRAAGNEVAILGRRSEALAAVAASTGALDVESHQQPHQPHGSG